MEQLISYLARTGKTRSAFAREAELSAAYITQILSGVRSPGVGAIKKISAATAGSVPPGAWFPTSTDAA